MSVLVSVLDHSAPTSLLHTQLELEAGVRIELTLGVLQPDGMGFSMFRVLAKFTGNVFDFNDFRACGNHKQIWKQPEIRRTSGIHVWYPFHQTPNTPHQTPNAPVTILEP